MAPLVKDDGTPRSKLPLPYLPVLNPCNLCPGRCCRLNVKVSLLDAVHYCSTLGVPFFSGLTLRPSDHKTHAFKVQRDPRLNPDEEGWQGSAEIYLRRKEDGACHALMNIGGYDRCGVYEARPMVCRLYPMAWTSDVAKGSPAMILCPMPFGVTEVAEERFLRDAETSIERWRHHEDIITAWHESSNPEERTVEKFVEFSVPRAAALMNVSVDIILSRGTAEQRLFSAMVSSKVLKPKT